MQKINLLQSARDKFVGIQTKSACPSASSNVQKAIWPDHVQETKSRRAIRYNNDEVDSKNRLTDEPAVCAETFKQSEKRSRANQKKPPLLARSENRQRFNSQSK